MPQGWHSMKLIVITTIAVLAAGPCIAQESGWSRAGAALGSMNQTSQDAYNRGVIQREQQEYMLESARHARLENQRIEVEATWKDRIAHTWQAMGLSQQEAISVASVYQLTGEQNAILLRVRAQGLQQSVNDALSAYKAYHYQLADQLIVASMAFALEQQAAKEAKPSTMPEQQSARH